MTARESDTSAGRSANRTRLIGFAMVALAAAAFSLSVIMARLSYDSGTDAATVILFRFVVGVLVLGVLIAATRHSFAMPRRKILGGMTLGVLFTVSTLCYFASFQRIPVSLAVLIFYTFPILVGVGARFTEGTRLTAARFVALLLAFIGIAIALRVDFADHDPTGLMLAVVPAVMIGAITLFAGRILDGADLTLITFYMMTAGLALMCLAVAGGVDINLPATAAGWVPFGSMPVFFIVGNLAFFAAFRYARSVDIAMMMNLEPITTIAFAIVLVGDRLSPVQFGGAALVIGAIFLMSAQRR